MTGLTMADVPFAEQVADDNHPLAELVAMSGGLGDAWRHRHALMFVARQTADDATFRAIVAECRAAEDNTVLGVVLCNPAVPLDLVRELIGCRYWIVCERAASDPRLTADEIVALTAHKHPGVRRGVCLNPGITDEDLLGLASDPVDWVAFAAAGVLGERANLGLTPAGISAAAREALRPHEEAMAEEERRLEAAWEAWRQGEAQS